MVVYMSISRDGKRFWEVERRGRKTYAVLARDLFLEEDLPTIIYPTHAMAVAETKSQQRQYEIGFLSPEDLHRLAQKDIEELCGRDL